MGCGSGQGSTDQKFRIELDKGQQKFVKLRADSVGLWIPGSGGQAIAHHLLHSESNRYFHNAVLLSSTLGLPIDSDNNYLQYGAITSSLKCCPDGLIGDLPGWVKY